MNKKLESKRVSRWLMSADISAEVINGKLIRSSYDESDEAGHYISNFKWCVREVVRLRMKGVTAYTKKVGDWCAVYSGLTQAEVKDLREAKISEDEVKSMIEADNRRAA